MTGLLSYWPVLIPILSAVGVLVAVPTLMWVLTELDYVQTDIDELNGES